MTWTFMIYKMILERWIIDCVNEGGNVDDDNENTYIQQACYTEYDYTVMMLSLSYTIISTLQTLNESNEF